MFTTAARRNGRIRSIHAFDRSRIGRPAGQPGREGNNRGRHPDVHEAGVDREITAVGFLQHRRVAQGGVGKRRHSMEGEESAALHERHVRPCVDGRVDTVELREVTSIGKDVHVPMRPLVSVRSGLRPDNALDLSHAPHDLVPFLPGIFRARLENRGDAPPLVLAYGGGRSLGAVEAVAYGEMRQRRIWVGKLIEVVGLKMIAGFRASGNRQRHRQPPQYGP